jgi:timeless
MNKHVLIKCCVTRRSLLLHASVVKQQIKLRENALAQSHMLMEYKRAITHHSSHHGSLAEKSKQPDDGNNNGGLLSIFVSLLAEPLSKTGTGRSDADHLTIELVLHLLRNLLSAEPILKGMHVRLFGRHVKACCTYLHFLVSSVAAQQSTQLHQELIALLDRELVLEIILVVGQEMELRENSPYNLLMMEILHNLLRSQVSRK